MWSTAPAAQTSGLIPARILKPAEFAYQAIQTEVTHDAGEASQTAQQRLERQLMLSI
jgi:hypothetical protein